MVFGDRGHNMLAEAKNTECTTEFRLFDCELDAVWFDLGCIDDVVCSRDSDDGQVVPQCIQSAQDHLAKALDAYNQYISQCPEKRFSRKQ